MPRFTLFNCPCATVAERHLQLLPSALGRYRSPGERVGGAVSGRSRWESQMSQLARSGVIGIARRKRPSSQVVERPLVTQPRADGTGFILLDSHAFRNAMNVLIARVRSVF